MLEKDKRLFMSQDATVKVREFLAQNEAFKKRTSATLPLKYSPQKNGWHVTVQSDGIISGGKGFTVEVVRVTVHSYDMPSATRIMRTIDAGLISFGGRWKLGVQASTNIITTPDSKLGGYVSSATYNIFVNRITL